MVPCGRGHEGPFINLVHPHTRRSIFNSVAPLSRLNVCCASLCPKPPWLDTSKSIILNLRRVCVSYYLTSSSACSAKTTSCLRGSSKYDCTLAGSNTRPFHRSYYQTNFELFCL